MYEFKNKHLKEYLGDIDFFLEQRAASNFREIEQAKATEKATTESKEAVVREEKLSFEQQKQQKSIQNKLNKVERNITEIEESLKAMDIEISKAVQSEAFYRDYEEKKQQLVELMKEWESLMS